MKSHTIERRLALGGTDYAERLVCALVKHPEITEVLTTAVVSTGEEGRYAADLRIVYRAGRSLSWGELMTVARHVPLYDVDTEAAREAHWEAEAQQKGSADDRSNPA